jgi:ABC-type amino acid transport substrate-binding protein
MKRITIILGVVLAMFVWLASPVLAEEEKAEVSDTMKRIEKTGKLRVGLREGAVPFSYMDPKAGKQVGFSVDMAHLIAEYLGKHFEKEITVQPFTVSPKTRIPMTSTGTVDIVCGSPTWTAARDKVVDFSIPFFFSDTTFLVAKDMEVVSLQDLNGKVIGAARGTTNIRVIRNLVEDGEFDPDDIHVTNDHPAGMLALRTGKIDAYSTDRSLLEGIRLKSKNPDNWKTVGLSIAYEPYAFIVRQNDSQFRDFVNNTIVWSIKTGKFFELYDKWMGPDGELPMTMSEDYKTYLEMSVYPIEEGWWEK